MVASRVRIETLKLLDTLIDGMTQSTYVRCKAIQIELDVAAAIRDVGNKPAEARSTSWFSFCFLGGIFRPAKPNIGSLKQGKGQKKEVKSKEKDERRKDTGIKRRCIPETEQDI